MFRSTTPSADSFSRSTNFFVSSPSEVSYLVPSEYRFFDEQDDTDDVGVEQVELGCLLLLDDCLAILVGVGDKLDGALRFTALK